MEIVKTYMGDYVLRVGKPTVVVTGYEEMNKLHVEYVIILETKGEAVTAVKGFKISKFDWKRIKEKFFGKKTEKELLEMFVNEWGVTQSKTDLSQMITSQAISNGAELSEAYSLDASINEGNNIGVLMYLKRKLPSQYSWLKDATKSTELVQIMDLINTVSVAEYIPENY